MKSVDDYFIYVVVSGYDYNALKPQVVQVFHQATGRKLRLDGDMKFDVGLLPTSERFQAIDPTPGGILECGGGSYRLRRCGPGHQS